MNPRLVAAITEPQKYLTIEKELGDCRGGTSINFALQPVNIGIVTAGFGMWFGIGANMNSFNLCGGKTGDKINGIRKSLRMRAKACAFLWGITAKGDNLFDPCINIAFCNGQCFGLAGIDAGQMRSNIQAVAFANGFGHFLGKLARRATRPIGNRYKLGVKRRQNIQRLPQIKTRLKRFWREKFK